MVFCFVQNFFFGQNKSLNIYFFCRAKCKFFFPEYNIRVYDKNSESDYFCFPPPKSEYFFPATLGIRIFFSIKTITPPFKLNGRTLTKCSPLQLDLEILLSVVFFLQLITIHMYMSF